MSHVYADKAHSGKLWKNQLCKSKRESATSVDGNAADKSPAADSLARVRRTIYKRLQEGHRESDTDIGAANKQATVTVAERKSGHSVMTKVLSKMSDLVGSAIFKALTAF